MFLFFELITIASIKRETAGYNEIPKLKRSYHEIPRTFQLMTLPYM